MLSNTDEIDCICGIFVFYFELLEILILFKDVSLSKLLLALGPNLKRTIFPILVKFQ